jgi:TetR/AcrR family transcriptional regulator
MDATLSSDDPVAVTTRKRPKPGERRLQILQMIATMLQDGAAEKVTTAALAAKLSLSEAALYRHFASKAQMYEGLLDFIEETIFYLINQIESRQIAAAAKGREMVLVLLNFAEKNPGMTRVLIGDAIVNEDARLQQRVNQFLDRVEASIRQCARLGGVESTHADSQKAGLASGVGLEPGAQSSLAMAYVQGRWLQFAKSGFRKHPAEGAETVVQALFP